MDMTWREFQLRKAGYFRKLKEQWRHTRQVAYWTYLSIPEKGQKMPIDRFMDLGDKSKKILSNRQKDLIISAQKRAMEEAKKLK